MKNCSENSFKLKLIITLQQFINYQKTSDEKKYNLGS